MARPVFLRQPATDCTGKTTPHCRTKRLCELTVPTTSSCSTSLGCSQARLTSSSADRSRRGERVWWYQSATVLQPAYHRVILHDPGATKVLHGCYGVLQFSDAQIKQIGCRL